MSMFLNMLYYMVLGLPTAVFDISLWQKYVNNKDTNLKSLTKVIAVMILGLSFSLTYFFINNFLRIVIILMLLIIFCKILLKKNIKSIIALSLFSMALIMVGEILFGFIYILLTKTNALKMLDTKFTAVLMNVFISLIAYGLSKIPFIKKLYFKLDELFLKLKNSHILIISMVLLFSVNFLFLSSYYKMDVKLLFLINTVISIIYLLIVFKMFSVENKYIKISDKYNTTLNSLQEYEEILDKYKIMNHENKNDLLMVRSMIVKKEKGIDKYIDKLIDTKIKDDEKLMYDTSIIPSGGLRATIYSKLLTIKDKRIKHTLHVDKMVRNFDLGEYDDSFALDLCKLISIYLDNAIEATLEAEKPEILIQIFMDSKKKFNISITNTYEGIINVNRIDNKGFSTKGEGHGYGLVLAKEILDRNNKIHNNRKIDSKTFNQTIIVEGIKKNVNK